MKIPQYLLLINMLFIFSCTPKSKTDLTKECLIPYPNSIFADSNHFNYNERTGINFLFNIPKDTLLENYILNSLKTSSKFELKHNLASKEVRYNFIKFELTSESTENTEAYKLEINTKGMLLKSNSKKGIIRGFQTIQQLILNNRVDTCSFISIPTGTIIDSPKYEYRGIMLDVARHFFSVTDVKRFIDLICIYKINKLHLHLSDDQGWRIEIKSWPNLTKIGGSTQVGGEAGGFYTQEDFIDIVNYANLRQIEVIPEIDMPGHTNAALASYSELNSNKKTPKLYTGTRVGFSSLNTNDELTYKFIDDVFREISAISPSKYIHIGGDESHSTKHKDYIYFINRVLKIAESHNKTIIGWDEISDADITERNIVQHWQHKQHALKAKQKHAKIIMSPASFAYLDMKYDSTTRLGLDWAGYISVEKAYSWLPDTIIQNINKNDILGIEAPLWSETIETIDDIEYLTFPRLAGYAEVGWTNDSILIWNNYKERLKNHTKIFNELNINYHKEFN